MSDDDDNHFYIELGKLDQNSNPNQLGEPIQPDIPPSNHQAVNDNNEDISISIPHVLADGPPSVIVPVKVDMSEIVAALKDFSDMIRSRGFGGGAMAGWNAGVCVSLTLSIIAIIVVSIALRYLQNNPSEANTCNCNCTCDYPLPVSSTSVSSTQFMDSNITTLSTLVEMVMNTSMNKN